MRPGLVPSYISPFLPYQEATSVKLDLQSGDAFAGVSKNGHACWLVKGPILEVVDIRTRSRLAAWEFGRVLGDQHTNVTCVKEFVYGGSQKLLVGVCNTSSLGMLCIFDITTSKVVQAVEIPYQITEVEVISNNTSDKDVPRWSLSDQLTHFCGVVAVGTYGGHILLVDMCLDDEADYSDEEVPLKLHFISPRTRDTEKQRSDASARGQLLAVPMNNDCYRNGFQYQKPDGITVKTYNPEVVHVTCLTYIPQAGILAVGFSFGCYQLWKLHIPVLEYSSRLESDPLPVSHIAYQEPENDPKNFCYIWVARGPLSSDSEEMREETSTICLYQLSFNKKFMYSNYGVFYDELSSVCLRLEHELTASPNQTNAKTVGGSKLVSSYTLVDPNYIPPFRIEENESFEESAHGPDLSLCVFVWEATEQSQSLRTSHHMAIFDINRWYHAQMPATVRFPRGSMDTCSYFSFYKLDDAVNIASPDAFLAALINQGTLRKFINNSPVPSEQHFYPSSLAFGAAMVMESGIIQVKFLGAQRQVLQNLEKTGPQALVQPHDLYTMCIYMGLLPRPMDVASQNPTLVYQREALLSLALEYNMTGFLLSCVKQWATGEYELQGCTLKFLLDWGWSRVSQMKQLIDSTCVNLYNGSGIQLDQRSMQTLYQSSQRLLHLIGLLKCLAAQSAPITEQGILDLESKIAVTTLISQHLQLVLWFVETGLLPEFDEAEELTGNQYSYPAGSLIQAYKTRRQELQQIHSEIGATDLLLVDGLADSAGVSDMWEQEGGNGLYPPPSLHAMLSVYLLEEADVISKHCLTLYLLLDLVSMINTDYHEEFSEKVSRFSKTFALPQRYVKLIQGFWLLDHRDFEEALVVILDPLVTKELSRWQHCRIIKSLLFQGDSKMALRYLNTVKPALTSPEEIKLKLTVLLASGLTAEALEYQRSCRDKTNIQDLLFHLFLGCQQTKTLDQLLQLPLLGHEEQMLVDYLSESTEPYSHELLVLHYLQRARFVEAIQLNEKLKHSVMTETNAKARERASARNSMLEGFAAVLPSVQRKLIFEQIHVPKKNTAWRREVRRPTPLSTKITKSNRSQVMSQATFIMTVMDKVDEIVEEEEEEVESPDKKEEESTVGPFICTPVTPGRKPRRSETPAVAYPSMLELDVEPMTVTVQTLRKSLHQATPQSQKRSSKFFSVECLTLLQTPKVKKVTPTKQRLSSANIRTPQSILKVRQMISSTSPSPQNITPSSSEVDLSTKKVPRKLGYSVSSQPGTPRSVSFAEPSSTNTSLAEDAVPASKPKHSAIARLTATKPYSFSQPSTPTGQIAHPSTPRSVSFAEVASPQEDSSKYVETSISDEEQHKAERQSPPSPGSPRSVRDRSPTPKSMELSPKFASKLDKLSRRPLRMSEKYPDNDAIDLTEEVDEDVTFNFTRTPAHAGEEEEMDTSNDTVPATSPTADISVTSTTTIKDDHERVSPQRSATIKIAKHPSPQLKVETQSTEMVAEESNLVCGMDSEQISRQEQRRDLPSASINTREEVKQEEYADEEMEVEDHRESSEGVVNRKGSEAESSETEVEKHVSSREPFKTGIEAHLMPSSSTDVPALIKTEVDLMEEEGEEVVSQSTVDIKPAIVETKQEQTEEEGFRTPPPPIRMLVPPTPPESGKDSPDSEKDRPKQKHSWSDSSPSPTKHSSRWSTSPSSPTRHSPRVKDHHKHVCSVCESHDEKKHIHNEEEALLELRIEVEDEISTELTVPSQEGSSYLKEEMKEEEVLNKSRSNKSKSRELLSDEKSISGVAPLIAPSRSTRSKSRELSPDSLHVAKAASPGRSTRSRSKELSPDRLQIQPSTSAARSTRSRSKELSPEVVKERSTRKRSKDTDTSDDLKVSTALSPARSTRSKSKDTSPEPVKGTPTRSLRSKSHETTPEDKETKVLTPTRSAGRRKEKYMEGQALRPRNENVEERHQIVSPPSSPTRSRRSKTVSRVEMDVNDNASLSPPRSTRRGGAAATPTRSRDRKGKEEDMEDEPSFAQATPPRGRGRRGKEEEKDEKPSVAPTTPTRSRGRKDKEEVIDEKPSVAPATPRGRGRKGKEEEVIVEKQSVTPAIPTRGRGKKVKEEDVKEDDTALAPSTPTRSRRGKQTADMNVDSSSPPTCTPTRSRRGKVTKDDSVVDTVSKPRTPTRSSKKKEEEEFTGQIADIGTPTRSSRRFTMDHFDFNSVSKPDTPTRASRRQTLDHYSVGLLSLPSTPTRSTRTGRSNEDKSQAAKSKLSTKAVQENSVMMEDSKLELTPSRSTRGRPKVGSTVKVTPGRGRKKQSETESESEIAPVTPTRQSRRGKKSVSPSGKDEIMTPSRQSSRLHKEQSLSPTRHSDRLKEKSVSPSAHSTRGHKKEDSSPEHRKQGVGVKRTPSRRTKKTKVKKSVSEEIDTSPARSTRSHDDSRDEKNEGLSHHKDKSLGRSKLDKNNSSAAGLAEVDIQKGSSFQFSVPMEVEHSEEPSVLKPFTPVKSFIFSPPLTRSTRHTEVIPKEPEPKAILLPEARADLGSGAKKFSARKRTKKTLYSPAEEVLLISPADPDNDSDGNPRRLSLRSKIIKKEPSQAKALRTSGLRPRKKLSRKIGKLT